MKRPLAVFALLYFAVLACSVCLISQINLTLFIMVTVLCFNIVGDALRDALDPKLRGTLGKRVKRRKAPAQPKRATEA